MQNLKKSAKVLKLSRPPPTAPLLIAVNNCPLNC